MPLSDIMKGLRVLWAFWNWFWFRPISARGVGVMRILLGVVFVMTTIDLWPDLEVLVGPEGVFHEGAAKRGFRMSRWTYFDHLDSMTAVYFVHALGLVANVLFMVGYKSRITGLLSVVAHTALYQRNSWFMNGGDRLVREFGFYLCLVPCGASLSVDAWLRDKARLARGLAPLVSPKLPIVGLRLIQLQIAFVYLISGIEKWASGSWQRGSALYYSLSTDNYLRSDWLVAPLLDGRWGYEFLKVGTLVTLYWECFFWLLVLWRPTRWLALVVGTLMHIGIHITLMVAFFSFISIWAYLAFLPDDWVERCEAWWRRRRDRSIAI